MEISDSSGAVRRAASRPGQWPQNVASALGERCALPPSGAENGPSDSDVPPKDDDGEGPSTPPPSGGQAVHGAGRGRGTPAPVPALRPGAVPPLPGQLAKSPAPVITLKPAGHR